MRMKVFLQRQAPDTHLDNAGVAALGHSGTLSYVGGQLGRLAARLLQSQLQCRQPAASVFGLRRRWRGERKLGRPPWAVLRQASKCRDRPVSCGKATSRLASKVRAPLCEEGPKIGVKSEG